MAVSMDKEMTYRISVEGRLGAEWSSRLQGMRLVSREAPGRPPVTELIGRLVDQAALMGVLEQLYNLGVPLLAVERLER